MVLRMSWLYLACSYYSYFYVVGVLLLIVVVF